LKLADEPRHSGSRKRIGRDGRRIRVGDYPVPDDIDDPQEIITNVRVGHRRDVYG